MSNKNLPNVLLWGILGLVFCWVPVLGIIFSGIGLGNAGKFAEIEGKIYGKAKVGKIFAVIGLICAICATVYWLFIAGALSSYR